MAKTHEDLANELVRKASKGFLFGRAMAYLYSGGAICPVCSADDIQHSNLRLSGSRVHVDVTCLKCHAVWTDGYALDSMKFRRPVTTEFFCEDDGKPGE